MRTKVTNVTFPSREKALSFYGLPTDYSQHKHEIPKEPFKTSEDGFIQVEYETIVLKEYKIPLEAIKKSPLIKQEFKSWGIIDNFEHEHLEEGIYQKFIYKNGYVSFYKWEDDEKN